MEEVSSDSTVASTSKSPSQSSLDENELATLIRVRNRLAQSADSALPSILTGLLPRLFKRLENVQLNTAFSVGDSSSEELQVEIRGHLLGILLHALERIRGNSEMPISWLPGALQSLQSDSRVVRTMTLSFVQAAMPKCSRQDAPVKALIAAIDRCHRQFVLDKITESSRMEWCSTGWLLLDSIAVASGLKPIMDWDIDSYNVEGTLGVYEPPNEALATPPLVSPEAIHVASKDGAGLWNLLLDLFFFSPTSERERRWTQHPHDVVSGGVSTEGRGRMTFRLKERSWNDMTMGYLNHLKVACFSFAVSKESPSLFQGGGPIGEGRAVMLAVLMANINSKVGTFASEYLSMYLLQVSRERERSGCSLAMACSLLVLILGDAASGRILERYSIQQDLCIAILGPRPSEAAVMRPPLSSCLSARAIEFISKNLIMSESSGGTGSDAARLFIDLTVAIQKNRAEDGLWVIRLIYGIHQQMNLLVPEEWAIDFRLNCLTCARDTISNLPDPEPVRPARADAAPENGGQLQWRRTEDELFQKHRQSLRKKRLRLDDAMKARQNAYELISSLGAYATIVDDEGSGTSFDLPIILFKCAVLEETMMKPRATEALGKLLVTYKTMAERKSDDSWTCHQAALLIPSLVDAACCESEIVRLASAQWAVEFLALVDPQAAYCLASFLADDVDFRVTGMVASIVDSAESVTAETPVKQYIMYEFLHLTSERDLDTLTMELNLRISSIAGSLRIPSSAACVLLLSFGGSSEAAVAACTNDREGVLERCGVRARCDSAAHISVESDDTFVCGICYDDEITPSDSYAMLCGHRFCNSCWRTFIENKLEEGPSQLLNASCPSLDCNERITGVEVNEIAPHLVSKWKDYLLRQFVVQTRNYRFCPGADCDTVIVAIGDTGSVSCNACEALFCFGCGEPPHIPARCGDFEKWKKIFGSSQFWVAKHSKPCPGCNVPIEKNQGCNHIRCSRCQYDFCWICLAHLDSHNMAHTCNRYDPSKNSENDDEKRELFFTERFQAHEEAEIFAARRIKGSDDKVENLFDKFWLLSEDDARALVDAEKTLVKCRGFLKNSYVAAYGIKDNEERREIFERHQGALELLTETLSGLTELNLDNLYVDRGEYGFRLYLRSIVFYTSVVCKYMERITTLD